MPKMGGLASKSDSVSGLVGLSFPENASEVESRMSAAWDSFNSAVSEIKSEVGKPTFENTVVALSRASGQVTNVAQGLIFYGDVAESEDVREACREVQETFSDKFGQAMSDRELYLKVKEVYDGYSDRSLKGMDPLDRRLLENTVDSFEDFGVHLPSRRRTRLLELRNRLAELGVEFERNMSEDKSKLQLMMMELRGCSPEIMEKTRVDYSNGQGTAWTYHEVSADYNDIVAIMTDCSIQSTRRKVKDFWDTRCLANLKVLEELHSVRTEIAKVMGYDSSSHYKLDAEMVRCPENAVFFLDHVLKLLDTSTRSHLESLVKLKRVEEGFDDESDMCSDVGGPGGGSSRKRKRRDLVELEPGDYLYYHNQYIKKHFGIDHQNLREYFPTDHVLNQMLEIYSDLLGLVFQDVTLGCDSSVLYHPSIMVFAVWKMGESPSDIRTLMGHFILDLYPREGKYTHFCEQDVSLGFVDDEVQRLPVVALIGNFPEGVDGRESLLTHESVETLFHEFGHVVHAICGGHQARYYQFSGNRVETDFNEMPSELFEQWVWEPWVLKRVSRHYVSGQCLPDDLIEGLISSRSLGMCQEWSRQACLSKIDLTIHSRRRLTSSEMVSLNKEMSESYLYQLANGEKLATWGHIGSYDYDSLNYSYVWSMVLACDLYGKFRSAADQSEARVVGEDFRRQVLEPGGSKSAWKMVKSFLGRPPNARNFLVDYLGLDASVIDKKMEDLNFESSSED